jgi:hypothetical protein
MPFFEKKIYALCAAERKIIISLEARNTVYKKR